MPRGLIQHVLLGADVNSAPELFAALAGQVHASSGKAASDLADRLSRRHRRQSTALGHGMALPHAVSRGLKRPQALFVRPRRPLPMDAPDGLAVSDVLALVVPWPATVAHGELLAGLAQLLTSWSLQRELRAALDADAILRVFAECCAA